MLWAEGFRRLSTGVVRSAASFGRAMATSPFTFNAVYADDRDFATYSAGFLPVRAPGVDSGLPTKGTGANEWRGFSTAPSRSGAATRSRP